MSVNMLEKALTGPTVTKIVSSVEKVFAPLPNLPKGLVSFLVGIVHWLALVAGIVGLINGYNSLFGNRAALRVLESFSGLDSNYFTILGVVQLLMAVLMLMAFKPLKERRMTGWLLLFDAELLAVTYLVLDVFYGYGFVGTLVSLAIGFYFLFQIKGSYSAGGVSKSQSK